MCPNAAATAASVMAGIEPTLQQILNATGLAATPDGIAAINAYNAAEADLKNWTPGTAGTETLELITDFQEAFAALPLPPDVELYGNLILGGIVTVIGIVNANSPAPVAAGANVEPATPPEMHQAVVAADTVKQLHALVPGLKLSRFHGAKEQYDNAWNNLVDTHPVPGLAKVG